MKSTFINYSTLQQLIDKLISRHGTEKTYHILKRNLLEKNPEFNQDCIIANIIANAAIEKFGLTTKQFKSEGGQSVLYARASCYRLIKMHTRLSYSDIVRFFNETLNINKIRYAIRKADDLLQVPIINREMFNIIIEHEKMVEETINSIP